MSNDEIIQHMIEFIETSERDLQAATLVGGGKSARANIVNHILKELEREMKDED